MVKTKLVSVGPILTELRLFEVLQILRGSPVLNLRRKYTHAPKSPTLSSMGHISRTGLKVVVFKVSNRIYSFQGSLAKSSIA